MNVGSECKFCVQNNSQISNFVHMFNDEVIDMKLSEVSKSDITYKIISRIFDICDLRSGQYHGLPIISQSEKFQFPLFAISWIPCFENMVNQVPIEGLSQKYHL